MKPITPTAARNSFTNKASLFLIILFGALSFAQAQPSQHPSASELNIRLQNDAVFNIRIGNQHYNHFQEAYSIEGIRPGRHFMEITRYRVVQNGWNLRYVQPEIVFSGYVIIQPSSRVFARIDHRGRYRIDDVYALQSQSPAPGPAYQRPPRPMRPKNFTQLMQTIDATSFDSNRLSIAKQAVASNHVSAAQILQLMNLLSFESNRLSLALFAYPYTIDKQNYFLVNDAFSFSSSVRQLNNHIAMYP